MHAKQHMYLENEVSMKSNLANSSVGYRMICSALRLQLCPTSWLTLITLSDKTKLPIDAVIIEMSMISSSPFYCLAQPCVVLALHGWIGWLDGGDEAMRRWRISPRAWTRGQQRWKVAILQFLLPAMHHHRHAMPPHAAPHARALTRRMRNHELTMMKGSNITRTDC